MTIEEAQKKADILNKKNPKWFCPLINSICNKNCLCYVKAEAIDPMSRILDSGKDEDIYADTYDAYDVTEAYCNNSMFN